MKVEDLLKVETGLIPEEHLKNLEELCKRVSAVESRWGGTFIVTSGYRTMADHERIYKNINARRLANNLPALRIPMGSRHLRGKAVDVGDTTGDLQKWILENVSLLEEVGLWCEDFKYTSKPRRWVHFQSESPASGRRFFKP